MTSLLPLNLLQRILQQITAIKLNQSLELTANLYLSFVQLSDQPLFQNSFILSFLKTMPSLSFQKPFVPGIRAMLDKDYATRLKIKPKTTTIRATRKRPFKKGDKLFLFSGLRTKYCHKLGEVICLKVEDIEISEFEIPDFRICIM